MYIDFVMLLNQQAKPGYSSMKYQLKNATLIDFRFVARASVPW